MKHIDALSRCHNVLIVEADSFEHVLAAALVVHPKIRKIVKLLEEKESSAYELLNGLVYRKIDKKVNFYVPSGMEKRLIQTHHDAYKIII